MKDIFLRRSVRKFTDEAVTKEQIEKIIRAGFAAPTAKKGEVWEFMAIDDKDILEKLSHVTPYAGWLKDAACCFIVLWDNNKVNTKLFHQDLAAATENMMLEAKYLGLGTCWIGTFPKEDSMKYLKELFNLPENIEPFSVIACGYPEDKDAFHEVDRYNEQVVHYNRW